MLVKKKNMKRYILPFFYVITMPVFADVSALSAAIDTTRVSCGGISEKLSHLKTMAGINTAVTGVGTGVGAGALAVGIVKSNVDKEIEELEAKIQKIIAESKNKQYPNITLDDPETIRIQVAEVIKTTTINENSELDTGIQELAAKEKKSKTLGNVRTGLMATNTATNIASVVIAGTNQVKDELESQVDKCILAVNNLRNVYMQERIMPDADAAMVNMAQQIITDCGEWETADVASINKRARGAAISSGIGAGVGLAGTITSGVANSDKVRAGDTDQERNLNTASNVLAGGATVASAAATVFNATQIAAVKRVVAVAEKCEGGLK